MNTGLLVISHGSRDLSWVALVDEAIAQAQWPKGLPVASSFLECVPGRSIQDGIDALEAQGARQLAVIPLFISSGSTHVDEIAWALGVQEEPLAETDLERFRVKASICYGQPIDEHEAVVDMVAERIRALSADTDSLLRVLLVAHGSPREPFQTRWREGLSRIVTKLAERGECDEAEHALLCCDDLPARVRQLAAKGVDVEDFALEEQTNSSRVTVAVVPLFLSRGYFTTKVIPERLAAYMPTNGHEHEIQADDSLDKSIIVLYDGQTLLPHQKLSVWLTLEGKRLLKMIDEMR